MSILFINGSPNGNGNTAALASLLWSRGRSLFIGKDTLFSLSGSGTGKMDAGSRRIYNETLCEALRHEICRHGNKQNRGR